MSTFLAARSGVLRATLTLLPISWLSGALPYAAPPAVRPPVALSLAVESTHYRNALRDPTCASTCRDLVASMQDSIKAILRLSYPFLDWDAPDPAPDTIDIRWVDWPPIALTRTQLEFRIRGPERRMLRDRYNVAFEGIDDFAARQSTDGWRPDDVRRQWLARFRDVIENTPDLQVEVFGRIPLHAQARIAGNRGHVPIGADELHVPAATRPMFAVQARVLDAAAGTDETGLFSLRPCPKAVGVGYSCELDKLTYVFVAKEFSKAEIATLLAQATVTPMALFVVAVPRRDNGTVFPGPGGMQ